MGAKTHLDVRLLFVVTNDYGELSHAMSCLVGQEFASRAAILLPDRLYSSHKDVLPIRTYLYTSLDDILTSVEMWNPDIVFLFSGYLVLVNRLLSWKSLDRLVRHLRDRGCRIVTSDPFLGLASWLATPWFVWDIFRILYKRHFSRVSRILQDVVHLYPAPSDCLGTADHVRKFSFFNPKIVRSSSKSVDHCGLDSANGEPDTFVRHWLFVISSEDLRIQQKQWGIDAFSQQVAHKLEQTLQANRRPVLISPPSLIREVSQKLPDGAAVDLVPFCPYPEFVSRLLEAEYAFYWNVFSYSVLPGLANGLPMFFFDRGHMARAFQLVHLVGLPYYFPGWKPNYLNLRMPLDASVLAGLAEDQEPAMHAIREYWQRSPTPEQLIDLLLTDPAIL